MGDQQKSKERVVDSKFLFRTLALDASSINAESRTVEILCTNESVVEDWTNPDSVDTGLM